MKHDIEIDEESFEQFEERCIFDCGDYFFYHKYTHESKKDQVHSLQEALAMASSARKTVRHLRLSQNDSISSEIFRSVAINFGQNLVSLCLCSEKLTDRIGVFTMKLT